ncbi:MAG: hypothetical protein WHX93_15760 [bacterium]
MSRLWSEQDLEGRMDCFGEFECTDEICLSYCGVNIACAASSHQELEEDWAEQEGLDGLPSMGMD